MRFGCVVLSVVMGVAGLGLVGCGGDDAAAAAPINTQTRVALEAPGVHCPSGGQVLQYGADGNGNGVLDDEEVKGSAYACNGANGADGERGEDGANGANGANGEKGDTGAQGLAGAPATEPSFGEFLPSQVVKGASLTCATVSTTATLAECRGLKLNGVDVYLGPAEANAICSVVTGKGYDTASGLGAVATHLRWTAGTWALRSGNVSPLQNLTCKR